jgi:hypothetical protein
MLGHEGRREQGSYGKEKMAHIPEEGLTFKSFEDKGQERRG